MPAPGCVWRACKDSLTQSDLLPARDTQAEEDEFYEGWVDVTSVSLAQDAERRARYQARSQTMNTPTVVRKSRRLVRFLPFRMRMGSPCPTPPVVTPPRPGRNADA